MAGGLSGQRQDGDTQAMQPTHPDLPLTRPPRPAPARAPSRFHDRRAERGARTRRRLIDAARTLFTEHGFAATGTPEIVWRAGVSRGALYHHFPDKQALFAAVYEDVERTMTARLLECWGANNALPYWDRMHCVIHTFLEAATDPTVRRIMMVEAPAVLGSPVGGDAASAATFRLLLSGLEVAQRDGFLDDGVDLSAAAHLLFGSFTDVAQWIATAEDGTVTCDRASALADRFLDSFRSTHGRPPHQKSA